MPIFYLHLYVPEGGSLGMPISIHNDYVIGQAIKGFYITFNFLS